MRDDSRQGRRIGRRAVNHSMGIALALVACGGSNAGGTGTRRRTPAAPEPVQPGETAEPPCEVTADNIEGPFFKPQSPERSVLVEDTDAGVRLELSGTVLTTTCAAIENAVLDFWQADANGAYDTAGFKFRGHVNVAVDGSYAIETVIPGRYLNGAQYRPAHIHVKAYVGPTLMLTTQLYFEGDPYNGVDPFIDPSLVMPLTDRTNGAKAASFDFVL